MIFLSFKIRVERFTGASTSEHFCCSSSDNKAKFNYSKREI